MPHVAADGIEMYYEEHGSGEPLLLIMGWGGNAATWKPQLPGLAERHHVIAFDNRGVGRTSAPDAPYSIAQMADDTFRLMDALGLERSNVLGISMGGMIAQELALEHPERIGRLILGCTSPGGPRTAGFDQLQRDIDSFRERGEGALDDLSWFSDFLRRLWTDEALASSHTYLQDFVFSLIRFPPTVHGLHHQAEAVARHDAYERLPAIDHPTLVITGDEDGLIDPRHSETLAARIPRADLTMFKGLRHAFHLERPDLVNEVILRFLDGGRPPKRRRRAKQATPKP